MKKFSDFIKEADVPTNVTGSAVATDQPIVRRKVANKYKRENARTAPKLQVEADVNAVGDSYVTPDEANLYVKRNNEVTLKISKMLKKLLSRK